MTFLVCLFYFTLAALAASISPPPDIFQEARGWFGSTRRKVLDRVLNKDTDPGIKNTLMGGDLTKLPTTADGQLKGDVWDALGAGPILSLTPPSRITSLLSFNKISSPNLAKHLHAILDSNVSYALAIQSLTARMLATQVKAPTYLEQLLLRKLGSPEQWLVTNVANMSQILFDLPSDMLARVQDPDAVKELDAQVLKCLSGDSAKSKSCPGISTLSDNSSSLWLMGLHSHFLIKLKGDPKTWSKTAFSQVDLLSMPPNLLIQVPNDVLFSWKKNVTTMLNNDSVKRLLIGRAVVRKLLKAEAVKQMTDLKQVETFLGSLGSYLSSFVYAEDLPQVALDKAVIKVNMETNAGLAARTGTLEATSVEALIQKLAQEDNMSAFETRTMGLGKLSLAPPTVLAQTFESMNPSKEEMVYLILFIQMNGGPTMEGKFRLIADSVFAMARNSDGTLDWDAVPPTMMDMLPLAEFSKVDAIRATTILKDMPPTLKPAQVRILLSKLAPAQKATTSAAAKTFLSLAEAKQILNSSDSETLKKLAGDMPTTSTLGKLVTVKKFYTEDDVPLLSVKDWLSYIDEFGMAKIARRFRGTLLKTLPDMKNAQFSIEACSRLQKALVEELAFQVAKEPPLTEQEVLSLLTATDVEDFPPCVIAAFGPTNMAMMNDDMKALLLEHVQNMNRGVYIATGIERTAAQAVLAHGIQAIGMPPELTGAGVQDFQETLLLAPPEVLSGIREDATASALKIFNDLAATPMMPCLDSSRRNALRTLIFRLLGPLPSQWTEVSPVCCLLYTLTSSDLASIPRGALVTCTCDESDQQLYNILAQEREVFCYGQLGSDYDAELAAKRAVSDLQTKAALTLLDPATFRKKRALSDEPVCDRAAISGVDSISTAELEAMEVQVLAECLSSLGSRFMAKDKAGILALKLPQSLQPSWYSSLSVKNLTDMGFILRGVATADIPGLPTLSYPGFNDAVLTLGDPEMDFSQEQLEAFALKVLKEWKSPISSWSTADILTVNRLLCGINQTDLMKLNSSSFGDALPVLGFSLEGCDVEDTLAPLALKAEEVYGTNNNWTIAMIQEMGVIFAGVSPEKIMGLRPEIMSGITPMAAGYISLDAVHVMGYTQLSSMRLATLRSLTPDPGNLDYQYALLNRLQHDDSGAATFTLHTFLGLLVFASALGQ